MAPLYPWRRSRWSSQRPSDQTGFRPSRSAPCSPLAMLVWNPQVGDLAAQVFRTELFQHAGLAIWNGSWYGGHYTLTYSFLFPPLASLLGPQLVGHDLGRRLLLLLRPPRPRPLGRAAPAGRRSGSPPAWSRCSPTASSPSPSASPSGSPRCAACRPGRGKLGARRRRGLRALQPGRRGLPRRGRPGRGGWSGAGRSTGSRVGAGGARARPRSSCPTSPSPNRASSPSPSPPTSRSRSGAAAPSSSPAASASEERQLRWVLIGYVLAATLLLLAPNPLGGNAVRLGALFGGPVLAAVMLARRPRLGAFSVAVLSLAMAGGLYWQVTASVSQIARSVGDPSTSRELLPARRRSWLRAHGGTGVRVEVPPTANHWESAYLAPAVRARPRLAAPARHHPRRHLLRRRQPADRRHLPRTGCATTRSPTSPCPTRRSTTPRSPSAA